MSGKKDLIIAIDGPAGSGKSTTAKLLAERLGIKHIDTGAMYRAVALKMLRLGMDFADKNKIEDLLQSTKVTQKEINNQTRIFLDNSDVTDEIRTPEISLWVGPVSENELVRQYLVDWQRETGSTGGCVLEGRDIGTVVFPSADLKIYMIADVTTRAKRRRKEMLAKGVDQPLKDIEAALVTRDERDSTRDHSPLRKAPDAIEIDTTDMTIGDQVDALVALVQKKGYSIS